MAECAQVDPLTGKKYMYGDSDKYKVLVQKENDRFRMEEGYETEYIHTLVKQHQQQMMRFIEMQKAHQEAAVPEPNKQPSEQDWSDVDEDEPTVAKTIEL